MFRRQPVRQCFERQIELRHHADRYHLISSSEPAALTQLRRHWLEELISPPAKRRDFRDSLVSSPDCFICLSLRWIRPG
jgi:hypothetical protein